MAYIQQAQSSLMLALKSDEIVIELQQVVEQFPMEIKVMDQGEIIFQTLRLDNGQGLEGVLNKDVVAFESSGLFDRDGHEILVWYSLYHMPSQDFFSQLVQTQTWIIAGAFILMFLMLSTIQYFVLKPLLKMKKTLAYVRQNRFDEIVEADDDLNEELTDFATETGKTIKHVNKKNTELEVLLNYQKQRLENEMMFTRVLIHELKTPVYQTLIENQYRTKSEMDEKMIELSEYNANRMDVILEEINQIIRLLANNDSEEEVYQTFDLIEHTRKAILLVKQSIKEKSLMVDVVAPETLMVKNQEMIVRMLIHNLVSNMVFYSLEQSTIEIDIDSKDDQVTMIFKNESDQSNINRLKQSEQLTNIIDTNHQYSTGQGLFFIENLVSMINGSYQREIIDHEIVIRITFGVNHE